MHATRFATIALLFQLAMPASALAEETPLQQTCTYRDALTKGVKFSTPQFRKLAAGYNSNTRKSLVHRLDRQLKRFDFANGKIFEVANLGGMTVEHLLVMRTKEQGMVYFRLIYELYGTRPTLVSYAYDDNIKLITRRHFLSPPKNIECP